MTHSISDFEEKDIAYHLHPFTDPLTHEKCGPLVIEKGEGIYLFDSAGNRYIDGMSSLWCCTLGYNEPKLIEAAHEQMLRLPYSHTFRGRSHPNLIRLAEKLIRLSPVQMSKVLFANSGSEANDSAIKMAWRYNTARGKPGKCKIITRRGAYHGSTVMTAGLSGFPDMHTPFSLPLNGVLYTDCPHYYRYALHEESETDYAQRLADMLDQLILREGADTIAAFIAEPVMGVGGVIIPPDTYFDKVQEILRHHDILMIADEVICGFGRTGNMFGSSTFDIFPDMISLAKGLSSAYAPISALMISPEIYETVSNIGETGRGFSHGFTYSGHPVSAAVAEASLRIYEERDICSHVKNVSKVFQSGLEQLLDHPMVGEIRSIGLMGAVELVANKESKERFVDELRVGDEVAAQAERFGLFVRSVGHSIVIAPPLIITETEIKDLCNCLDRAIDSVSKKLSSK